MPQGALPCLLSPGGEPWGCGTASTLAWWTAQKNWLHMGIWVMLVKASGTPHISRHPGSAEF
jgi:hypothetical protein